MCIRDRENAMLGGTVVLSIVIALALFFALPYFLSGLFKKVISSQMLIAFIEGVIRLSLIHIEMCIRDRCSGSGCRKRCDSYRRGDIY